MSAIDQSSVLDRNNPVVVEIYAAGDCIEAQAAATVLEDEGIEVQVVGEMLDSVKGGIPFGEPTAPRLWVASADAHRAEQLLARWQTRISQRRSKTSVGAFPPGVKPIFIGLIVLNVSLRIAHAMSGGNLSRFLSMIVSTLLLGYFLFVVYYHAKHRNIGSDGEL